MNNVCLMGRITHDLELKGTQTGKNYLRFSIAVNRNFGDEKQTDFIDCIAWERTAEFIAKYFSKGSMIAIVGRLQTTIISDDIGKRKLYSVVVNRTYFCGGKNKNSDENSENCEQKEEKTEKFELTEDDLVDLPF